MARLLKHLLLVVTIIALSTSMVYAQKIRVGFAAEPYPPFTVPDAAGNWTGWEIEIIKAVCEEAGIDYELTPTSWDGIIPALLSKKIDMIMGSMSITEARLKKIDFTDKYFKTPAMMAGPKSMDFEANAEGVKGKIVGVQTATTHAAYAEKYFKDAQVKLYQTQDEIFQDLVAGRIDATQADGPSIIDFLKTDEGQACCDLKGSVPDDPGILGRGVGVGVRKGSDELKAKINAAIKAIRANGKYQEITKKYFDFDVYGD